MNGELCPGCVQGLMTLFAGQWGRKVVRFEPMPFEAGPGYWLCDKDPNHSGWFFPPKVVRVVRLPRRRVR